MKEPSGYFMPTTEQVQMVSHNRGADFKLTSYQVTQLYLYIQMSHYSNTAF